MKNKGLTVSIIIVFAAVIYYFYMKKKEEERLKEEAKKKKTLSNVTNQANGVVTDSLEAGGLSTPSGGTGTSTGKYNFTTAEQEKNLSKGSTGKNVKALQLFLISRGKNVGASGADGIFGTNTENALFAFDNVKATTLKDIVFGYDITAIDEGTNKIYGKMYSWSNEIQLN